MKKTIQKGGHSEPVEECGKQTQMLRQAQHDSAQNIDRAGFLFLKQSVFFILIFLACNVHAQQKKAPASLALCDSNICTNWRIDAVEEFSIKGKPDETRQKDAALFSHDKTAVITLSGKTVKGSWLPEKNKNYVNVTSEDGKEKLRLKLITLTKDELVFEHQNPDLIRTIYYFVPDKK